MQFTDGVPHSWMRCASIATLLCAMSAGDSVLYAPFVRVRPKSRAGCADSCSTAEEVPTIVHVHAYWR